MIHAEVVDFLKRCIELYDEYREVERKIVRAIGHAPEDEEERVAMVLLQDRQARKRDSLYERSAALFYGKREYYPDFKPVGSLVHWERLLELSPNNPRAKVQVVTHKMVDLQKKMSDSYAIFFEENIQEAKVLVEELSKL